MKKGIGLVEVIASLAIAVVVITALVSLAVFSVRVSSESNMVLNSTKYASKQMELLRAFRDTVSWCEDGVGFINAVRSCTSSAPCQITSATYGGVSAINWSDVDASYVAGADPKAFFYVADPYGGTVQCTAPITKAVRITSVSKWRSGKLVKNTALYTDLSNWQNR